MLESTGSVISGTHREEDLEEEEEEREEFYREAKLDRVKISFDTVSAAFDYETRLFAVKQVIEAADKIVSNRVCNLQQQVQNDEPEWEVFSLKDLNGNIIGNVSMYFSYRD